MRPKEKLKNIARVRPIVIDVTSRSRRGMKGPARVRSEKLKRRDWLVHCPQCGKVSAGHYSGLHC